MKKVITLSESDLISLIEKTIKEYDKPAMSNFVKKYGKKKGKEVYYATANKQKRNPETFKLKESVNKKNILTENYDLSENPLFSHLRKDEISYCEDVINLLVARSDFNTLFPDGYSIETLNNKIKDVTYHKTGRPIDIASVILKNQTPNPIKLANNLFDLIKNSLQKTIQN